MLRLQLNLVLIAGCSAITPQLRAVRPAVVRASSPLMMAKSTLPKKIQDRISFATGGAKTANQGEEIEILWNTFRKCYASEALALEAVTKNSAVLQPQYNSPTKIKGTYALLQKRFGKAGATDIITRNPGVLICSPGSMEKQSDEEILKAADLVQFLDDNKGAIQALATVVWLAFVALIAYVLAAKGNPEAGWPLIGQCVVQNADGVYGYVQVTSGLCPP